MGPADPTPDTRATTQEPAQAHLRCIRCGYVLAGLFSDGDCPECGVAIDVSLGGDHLAGADPDWLGQVQRGLRLVHLGTLAALSAMAGFYGVFLLGLLGRGVAVILGVSWPPTPEMIVETLMQWLIAIVPCAAIAAAIGGWLVTTAEPRDADVERLRDARAVARWGPALAVAFAVAARMVRHTLPAPHDRIIWFAALLVAGVLAGVGLAALLDRLRHLATRVPAPELAAPFADDVIFLRKQAWIIGLAISVRLTAFVLTITAPTVGASPAVQGLDAVATLAIAFAVLATMVRAIRPARLAGRLRTAIEAARTQASAAAE